MDKRPTYSVPLWRETPLDHWSADIDPAIMAGDEWAGLSASTDPGVQQQVQTEGPKMRETFMHPMHDTNYGLEDDVFTDEPSLEQT
jgi:hypothetical protein